MVASRCLRFALVTFPVLCASLVVLLLAQLGVVIVDSVAVKSLKDKSSRLSASFCMTHTIWRLYINKVSTHLTESEVLF